MLIYLAYMFDCEYFSFLLFVIYGELREILVKRNYSSTNLARSV